MEEIPQWQKDLVLARLKYAEEHPEDMIDWDEAKKILTDKNAEEKKARLNQLFGTVKIKEDAVTLQRRWRD
jgi:hypothetical protein